MSSTAVLREQKSISDMAASLELKSCVKIPDDFPGYDVDSFCLPPHYRDSVANVLIPHGQIQVRG